MTPKINYFSQIACRRVAPLLFAQSHHIDLSPRDAARLNTHLQSCVPCQREAADLAAVGKMLRQYAPAVTLPPSDLWSRIEAEIAPQNQNAPSPLSRRPMVRRAPFAPALGGMAWAGSCAIVLVWGGWMAFGSGFWGRVHSPAKNRMSVAQTGGHVPATLTLIPPSPAPGTAARQAEQAVGTPSSLAPAAVDIIAANRAAKKEARKAAPVSTPRADPFALLASQPHPKGKMPSGLVAVSNVPTHSARLAPVSAAAPKTTAQTAVRVASTVPSFPVVASTDALAQVPSVSASMPNGEAAVSDASTPAAAAFAGTKTLGATSVYANPVAASAPSASANVSAASLLDETGRTMPSPSSANGGGAFSVADAATKAQRQRALFSYSRP